MHFSQNLAQPSEASFRTLNAQNATTIFSIRRPSMQPSPSTTLRPAISLMEKTPQLLETMLGGVAPDVARWKPAPDRWSISEVLSHLADCEDCLAERVRRFVLEDSPQLKEYEMPADGFASGTPQEHLSRFAHTR